MTTSLLQVCALATALLTYSSAAFSGFEKIKSSSVVVIYATEEGRLARDCVDADCRSGPLAKAIEAALKIPDITISGFFDAVTTDVAAITNETQKPRLEASQAINVPLVEKQGRAFALIIGNGGYANFTRLTGAPRDAEIVAKALGNAGFQTRTIIDAKLPAINMAIDEFLAKLDAGDSAVVYYAGLGFQINGGNYLPAIEAETSGAESLTSSSIALSTLVHDLSRSKGARKILILDTNYPNKIAGSAVNR